MLCADLNRKEIQKEGICINVWASLMTKTVMNWPAMKETYVQSLGWEDTQRREWVPTPVLLPGEFHRQRSLAGYSSCGHKKLDTTERQTLLCIHVTDSLCYTVEINTTL